MILRAYGHLREAPSLNSQGSSFGSLAWFICMLSNVLTLLTLHQIFPSNKLSTTSNEVSRMSSHPCRFTISPSDIGNIGNMVPYRNMHPLTRCLPSSTSCTYSPDFEMFLGYTSACPRHMVCVGAWCRTVNTIVAESETPGKKYSAV